MIPSDAYFKIWFMEGGFGKIYPAFKKTLAKIRDQSNQGDGL